MSGLVFSALHGLRRLAEQCENDQTGVISVSTTDSLDAGKTFVFFFPSHIGTSVYLLLPTLRRFSQYSFGRRKIRQGHTATTQHEEKKTTDAVCREENVFRTFSNRMRITKFGEFKIQMSDYTETGHSAYIGSKLKRKLGGRSSLKLEWIFWN